MRLMDSSVENKRAAETLRQAIAVYEALMCYCVNTWSLNTPDQGSKLLSMFKCYARLTEYAKVLPVLVLTMFQFFLVLYHT